MKQENPLDKRYNLTAPIVEWILVYIGAFIVVVCYNPAFLDGSKTSVFTLAAICIGCVIFTNGVARIIERVKTWLKDLSDGD